MKLKLVDNGYCANNNSVLSCMLGANRASNCNHYGEGGQRNFELNYDSSCL